MRALIGLTGFLFLGAMQLGCVAVRIDVANPIPEMKTVAVAPFFNLSQERAVDGRRFALAYYSELQKVKGFKVVPVGVVEQAIFDNQLELSNPDDVLALAQLLNVDAVVVGAVTDYESYYPPRIGLQVSWYSPKSWSIQAGDCAPCQPDKNFLQSLPRRIQFRAQSPVPDPIGLEPTTVSSDPQTGPPSAYTGSSNEYPMVIESSAIGAGTNVQTDPRQPVMSYTRLFDGADADLVAKLRDYVELNGDLRSGGWEAYLHRSEDFIRFTAHVVIVEMLTAHGGEVQRRYVFKKRNHR